MRYLFCIVFVIFCCCTGNVDNNGLGYFASRQFSIDTVRIDPGNEIIFLKARLFSSDLDESSTFLYNFNEFDATVEKINLNDLRLVNKFPFEREGPNGIGRNVAVIDVHGNNQVAITGMFQMSLFSLDGKKLKTVFFQNFSLGGQPTDESEQILPRTILDLDANRLYVLAYRNADNMHFLGILHLDKYEISKIGLKSFEKLPDYSFEYTISGEATVYMKETPAVSIDKFGNKILLSNEITSTLMWYDTDLDSLFTKTYSSQLTDNQKRNKYIRSFISRQDFDSEFEKYREEINFLAPFWDPDNELFYRFSYLVTKGITKVYLTAYDKELNQIGEVEVHQLSKKPARHFVKDGQIWIFENINDDMAFVRLDFD